MKLHTVIPGLLLFAAIPSMAAVVVVGLPASAGSGNCFPWGCAYNAEYQQVYASSAFPGPITITDLEFYNTQFDNFATQTPTGTYQISLSTTSAGVNSLDPTFANNLGGDNTMVFNGALSQPWAFGDTLEITLTTPFTYDPGNGNLLMDVVGSGTATATNIYFDVGTNGDMSRLYCSGGIACGPGVNNPSYGLITGFSTGEVITPEPSTMLLLVPGLVAGLLLRRKTAAR